MHSFLQFRELMTCVRRCGVVLKNIGTLFEASLLDNGATGFTFPPGPNVCPAADGNGNYAVVAALL